MIEECTPQPVPKPERVAFRQVTDNRLNHSPLSTHDNNVVTYKPQREDPTVRKVGRATWWLIVVSNWLNILLSCIVTLQIMFDDMSNEDQSQNLLNKMLSKTAAPKPSTPSLRTYRTPEKHSRPTQNHHMPPPTAPLMQPSNLDLSFSQTTTTKPRPEAKLNSTPRQPHQLSPWNYYAPPPPPKDSQQNLFMSAPAAATENIPPPCQCQCQHKTPTEKAPNNHLPQNKISPLNVITDNVMRMLSPKPSRTRADQLRYSNGAHDSDRVSCHYSFLSTDSHSHNIIISLYYILLPSLLY